MPISNIHVIAASAGSGKTYRLAQALNEALEGNHVRPEGVVAVTFTNKAAAELQQRARSKLLEAHRFDDAQRLAAGRFGTVNAVCGRLVAEHCFELGLPPEQVILDERGAATAIRRALSLAVSAEQTDRLEDLRERLYALDWESLVQQILSLARANRMGAEDLRDSGERSVAALDELLSSAGASRRADAVALETALAEALRRFQAECPPDDQTKVTARFSERVDEARYRLDLGLPLLWDSWARLASQSAGKSSGADDLAEGVRQAAGAYIHHPGFRQDLVDLTRLVFDIASRTLEVYSDEKRARGAVDFIDQETLALDLLERSRVREQLASEIDLVLVDEFQDTSPIQLEIFLRLAELADRSIWVGDQKQAIYGFRGTDPALMDAVIESLLAGKEPETLMTSWRSRAPLVDLTSELFARAFARHGLPESRVRLEAQAARDPAELGPVVEHWRLTSKNKPRDAACLAAGARALREDRGLRVRDERDGTPRSLRWSDVAFLCRTNRECATAARELRRLGIPCRVPGAALLATPEAQAVLAGLQLWVDPSDRLAVAVLRRLAASSPDEFLEATLAPPGAAPALDGAEAIRKERALHRECSPLEALEHVLEALDVRRACLAWGDHQQRLANLDAIRGHAAGYLAARASEGRPVSVTGLVHWLEELGESDADTRAVDTDADAVTVSTWHAAKGLEWPVVVLYEVELDRSPVPLGAHVMQEGEISLHDPLAGRWIRFWPNPFYSGRTKTAFHEALENHPAAAALEQRDEMERLRLLYVGWTRARDRLILTNRIGGDLGQAHRVLADADGPLLSNADETGTTWGGRHVDVVVRALEGAEPLTMPPEPGDGYAAPGPTPRPPAFLRPSEMLATGTRIVERYRLGDRIPLRGNADMDRLGEAVHRFLAADTGALTDEQRRIMAESLLARWDVADHLDSNHLLEISDRLRLWLREHHGEANTHREVPLTLRLPTGVSARGLADLVLEEGDICSVLDHKTFPGGQEGLEERLPHYGGQLSLYERALTAAWGKPCSATYLHLPILGVVARVESSRS